ncbi:MAG: hypothetical protein ACOVMN_00040, partial [Flexibacteraceae bacterium]
MNGITSTRSYFNTVEVEPDGKLLVGGQFFSYGFSQRYGLARVNTNGSVDNTFIPPQSLQPVVEAITRLSNGQYLMGGLINFHNGLVRLNSNGSFDATFSHPIVGSKVSTIITQPDNKILIGGQFNAPSSMIARINPDGTVDNTFQAGTGFNAAVKKLYLYPNGKILAIGDFSAYNGRSCNRIARLNSNGSFDTTFATGTGFYYILGPYTRGAAIQPDGKIVVVGRFDSYNGHSSKGVVRLNENGSVDTTFRTYFGVDFYNANAVLVQPNGKIIVGGYFDTYNSSTQGNIVRLNSDGTRDITNTFQGGTQLTRTGRGDITSTGEVFDLKFSNNQQSLIIGGDIFSYGSTGVNTVFIVNLECGAPATPTISASGSVNLCQGGSVQLSAPSGFRYLWSNGATSQNITVNTAGSYSVQTIPIEYSCLSARSNVINVAVSNPNPSTGITNSGATTLCTGESVVLTAPNGYGYLWSNNETTRSITVTQTGSYSVRTILNGCTSSVIGPVSITVNQTPNAPTISAGGPTTFCSTRSVTLTATGASNYLWSNGATTAQVTINESGLYSVRTAQNGCTSLASNAIQVTVNQCGVNVFTGTGAFSEPARWSLGYVPNGLEDVQIAGNVTVTQPAFVRNITIQSGFQITLNGNNNMFVGGNIINNGVITGTGNLNMTGTNWQTMSKGTYNNLYIGLNARIRLLDSIKVANIIVMGGNSVFDLNNRVLTMLATASTTARISPIISTASIINASNFTVQRWLDRNNVRTVANGRGNYYLVGPTLQGQTVNLWNRWSPYNNQTFSGSGTGSLYLYNSLTNSWAKPSSSSQQLAPGNGIQVWFGEQFFFGRNYYEVKGSPVFGTYTFPIEPNIGFHLVANPYPSSIDWGSPSGWTKTNIANAVYIYDWKNRRYSTYIDGVGINGGSRYIGLGQGFFVYASSTNASLVINEGGKSFPSPNLIRENSVNEISATIRLQTQRGSMTDEVVIAHRPNTELAFEPQVDARKMINPATNIFVGGAVRQSIASMDLN